MPTLYSLTPSPDLSPNQVAQDTEDIVKTAGLTLTEIALALGVSKWAVRSWHQRRVRPGGWTYARLQKLKRLAHYSSLAMPFNSPAERRRWWLAPMGKIAASPLELFALQVADGHVQKAIEREASLFGRALLNRSTPAVRFTPCALRGGKATSKQLQVSA